MQTESLAQALELEHREIDAGLAICTRLTAQLLHHNLKEERIVYPRADDIVPAAAGARLRAVLTGTDLPEGWVCARATPASRHAGR